MTRFHTQCRPTPNLLYWGRRSNPQSLPEKRESSSTWHVWFNGKHVTVQRAVFAREMQFIDVTNVYWRTAFNGVIRLDSSNARLRIGLDNFERAERLQLIEFFRQLRPEEIQHG